MSHGRYKPRHPRAPAPALSDDARPGHRTSRLWIGPPVALSADAWHERGVNLECAGDLPAAIECYRWALRVGGPDPQRTFDLAYALGEARRHAEAAERYWQVIEADPARQDAWVNLGDALLSAGDDGAAIIALQHAVAIDPDDAVAHYDLADAIDRTHAGDPTPHWRAFVRLACGPSEQLRYAVGQLRVT